MISIKNRKNHYGRYHYYTSNGTYEIETIENSSNGRGSNTPSMEGTLTFYAGINKAYPHVIEKKRQHISYLANIAANDACYRFRVTLLKNYHSKYDKETYVKDHDLMRKLFDKFDYAEFYAMQERINRSQNINNFLNWNINCTVVNGCYTAEYRLNGTQKYIMEKDSQYHLRYMDDKEKNVIHKLGAVKTLDDVTLMVAAHLNYMINKEVVKLIV
jgi:hypothetical protein